MAKMLEFPTDGKILECIKKGENFHIFGIAPQRDTVKKVEDLIEGQGYTVRVKTKGREATLLLAPLWALNVAAQAAHTLATYDPDWVIYKHVFGSKIEVKYFGKDL